MSNTDAKAPRDTSDVGELDAEIARLKQELSRQAVKVGCIRRQRRVRTMVSAVAGGVLFGLPTAIVYAEAGLFAALVGALAGFCAAQLYSLVMPSQLAIGSTVRRYRNDAENLGLLLDERRRRSEKASLAAAAESASPARRGETGRNRTGRRARK